MVWAAFLAMRVASGLLAAMVRAIFIASSISWAGGTQHSTMPRRYSSAPGTR